MDKEEDGRNAYAPVPPQVAQRCTDASKRCTSRTRVTLHSKRADQFLFSKIRQAILIILLVRDPQQDTPRDPHLHEGRRDQTRHCATLCASARCPQGNARSCSGSSIVPSAIVKACPAGYHMLWQMHQGDMEMQSRSCKTRRRLSAVKRSPIAVNFNTPYDEAQSCHHKVAQCYRPPKRGLCLAITAKSPRPP